MEQEGTVISYTYKVSAEQMVRFHLLCYTHMNDIDLTKTEMNALVLLGLRGSPALKEFCSELSARGIYLSSESARNAIGELCIKKGMVVKKGSHRKVVSLSPGIQVSPKEGTMLSINCIHAAKNTKGADN